jgi:CheY-like chemotaxis protein
LKRGTNPAEKGGRPKDVFEMGSNKFQGADMPSIVLVTSDPNNFREFAKQLKATPQVQISFVRTKAEAITMASTATPALMILDGRPDDKRVFQLVRDLIMANASIPIAVVSQMPEKEFEAAGEGLGILAQLKPYPGKPEARMLISKLKILKPLF